MGRRALVRRTKTRPEDCQTAEGRYVIGGCAKSSQTSDASAPPRSIGKLKQPGCKRKLVGLRECPWCGKRRRKMNVLPAFSASKPANKQGVQRPSLGDWTCQSVWVSLQWSAVKLQSRAESTSSRGPPGTLTLLFVRLTLQAERIVLPAILIIYYTCRGAKRGLATMKRDSRRVLVRSMYSNTALVYHSMNSV